MKRANNFALDELLVASDWLEESGSHLSALLLLEYSNAFAGSECALSLETDRYQIQQSMINHHWDFLKLSDISFDVFEESKVVPHRLVLGGFHLAAHVLDSIVKPFQSANVAFARALLELPDVEFWQVFIATLASSQIKGCDLTEAMVRCGFVWRSEIVRARAREHNATFRDLANHHFSLEVLELCPGNIARDYRVIPFDSFPGGIIFATSEPGDLDLYEQLRFILNCDIQFVTSPEWQILEAVEMNYPLPWESSFSPSHVAVNLVPEDREAIESGLLPQRHVLEVHSDEDMARFRGLWRSVQIDSNSDD